MDGERLSVEWELVLVDIVRRRTKKKGKEWTETGERKDVSS